MARDIITLRGLTADGHHGVNLFEREGTQPFSVDVSMLVDTRDAARTDNVNMTESYADIADEVVAVLRGPSVSLIETLANRIADMVLLRPRIVGVVVTVHKPQAPIRQRFSDVSVTVTRGEPLPAVPHLADSRRKPRIPHWDADEFTHPDQVANADGVSHLDEQAQEAQEVRVATAAGGAPEQIAQTLNVTPPAPPTPARQKTGVGNTEGHLVNEMGEASGPLQRRRLAHPRHVAANAVNVVVALGGNLGNVPVTLRDAVEALVESEGINVQAVSALVRTAPVLEVGQAPQPDYWNAVVLARTWLEPTALLRVLQGIEKRLGRVRHEHWGARTVDVDLIQYQGVTSTDPELTLPHPRAFQRAFVLYPWFLLDPQARLEGQGLVAELLAEAPDVDGVLDAVDGWLDHPYTVQAESDRIVSGNQATFKYEAAQASEPVQPQTPEVLKHRQQSGSKHVSTRPAHSKGPAAGDGAQPAVGGSRGSAHAARAGGANTASVVEAPVFDSPLHREVSATRDHAKRAKAALASDRSFVDALESGGDDPVFEAMLVSWKNRQHTQPAPTPQRPRVGKAWGAATGASAVSKAAQPLKAAPAVPGKRNQTAPAAHSGAQMASVQKELPTRRALHQRTHVDLATSHVTADSTAHPAQAVPTSGPVQSPSDARPTPSRLAKRPAQSDSGVQAVQTASPQSPPVSVPAVASMPVWKPLKPTSPQRDGNDGAALPSWDFQDRQMRIVDDPQELRPVKHHEIAPTASAQTEWEEHQALQSQSHESPSVPAPADPAVSRRSILQPRLAADTPVGPLQHDDTTQTAIFRRLTLRPTTTGMVPVMEQSDQRQDRNTL